MKAPSFFARAAFAAFACAALVLAFFSMPGPVPAADPQPTLPPYQSVSPVRVLGIIRRVYRERRPPPMYETYTLVRKQDTNYGAPDYANSYTKHYWVRNTDRAALVRMVYRDDYDGDMSFDRPALNQPRDPGPATADLFEPAHPQPVSYVPTPEPTTAPLKTIGSIIAFGESDYNVPKLTVEGNELHLVLQPRRDPERNVLREIWIDKHSYELRKIIAHDRLFDGDDGIYPMVITYTLGYLQGQLLVTRFHGVILPRVDADGTQHFVSGIGSVIDIDFQDITFPSSLPAWYFDPRTYAQHQAELPI